MRISERATCRSASAPSRTSRSFARQQQFRDALMLDPGRDALECRREGLRHRLASHLQCSLEDGREVLGHAEAVAREADGDREQQILRLRVDQGDLRAAARHALADPVRDDRHSLRRFEPTTSTADACSSSAMPQPSVGAIGSAAWSRKSILRRRWSTFSLPRPRATRAAR